MSKAITPTATTSRRKYRASRPPGGSCLLAVGESVLQQGYRPAQKQCDDDRPDIGQNDVVNVVVFRQTVWPEHLGANLRHQSGGECTDPGQSQEGVLGVSAALIDEEQRGGGQQRADEHAVRGGVEVLTEGRLEASGSRPPVHDHGRTQHRHYHHHADA